MTRWMRQLTIGSGWPTAHPLIINRVSDRQASKIMHRHKCARIEFC